MHVVEEKEEGRNAGQNGCQRLNDFWRIWNPNKLFFWALRRWLLSRLRRHSRHQHFIPQPANHEGTHQDEHLAGAVAAGALGAAAAVLLGVVAGVLLLGVAADVLDVTSSGRTVWFTLGSGIGNTYESTKMSFCAPSLKL